MAEAIYDETGSKLLVQALLADNDTATMAAVAALRRYIEREKLPPHDIKVFFGSGPISTWMRGVMSLMERAQQSRIAAENGMNRYRKRLVLVETAFRRIRSIMKDVGGSDTQDTILQWHMQSAHVDDSDRASDPAETEYIHLLRAVSAEKTE